MLAADSTTLKLDLRQRAQLSMNASTFYAYSGVYALAMPVHHIHLVSKAFPWSIDIKSPTVPLTCEAVWNALYAALQEPIADSEWGFFVGERKIRETIEKAAKKRGDKVLKRIDYLGESTVFRGLEKADEFQRMRLLPGTEVCTETWVVKMSD
ncbi:hypothetical protein BDP27DRAFT_1318667 [Rhodocollybia butyracea]|uniref:DUF6699 domain-containing protein n=1 Tax=Rhodocollybia butyracea TaxID=206335 RepID=A0A9P5Q2Y7_9AGAR|nr:hypothetical protein BDP27DRAFT_1318667 [Rhodocollybia butyracea]